MWEGLVFVDPLWNSARARELAAQRRLGALIRLGRERRAWTQAALGERLGCSPATVSRLERSTRIVDLVLVQRAALEVGVPRHVLVTSLAPPLAMASADTKVTRRSCAPPYDAHRHGGCRTGRFADGAGRGPGGYSGAAGGRAVGRTVDRGADLV
ncbi:helix-turn-helix domain-containing protein [Streptomyces sp. NBC_00448]|uniref:helix-turn-helix domain-containing protein n=1 Tax=Streptomyces sp. NBC_00448 TaxID=2903652 RepID=UPI002E1E3C67